MWIEVDLSSVPPGVTLHDAEDLRSFKVVVRGAEHAHVAPDTVRALAGAHGEDPGWCEQFEGMLAYAASKGWVREDGAIRAHVEPAGPAAGGQPSV